MNRREKVGIKKIKNPKAFNDCLETSCDIYENLGGYNSAKERKLLIVFGVTIADMQSNKELVPIVTKLF